MTIIMMLTQQVIVGETLVVSSMHDVDNNARLGTVLAESTQMAYEAYLTSIGQDSLAARDEMDAVRANGGQLWFYEVSVADLLPWESQGI
jgi:hypothetical protein